MNKMKISIKFLIALLAAFIFVLGLHQPLFPQTFGKNKVQYTPFDWYYVQSQHFDIYFTEGGDELASFTARAAEEALIKIQNELRYKITNRIPFIVYNSHNDFQQTNVVGAYLEEGIGGLTEPLKNRIVVPFEGSYKMFRHVIHHELVHAYINEMFYGGSLQSMLANNIQLQLPLWFNEGLAEYLASGGWETNSDMFIRDAVSSNYLPRINQLYGYFAYRGGQSIWWYISEKYGKQKIGEIVNRIRTSRNLNEGFKATIGLTVEELSERWQKDLKVMYYPDIAKYSYPESFAKRMTNHSKLQNFYNTSPAISPNGDRIAFISDRDDYFSVYVMSATDMEDVKKLIEGQKTNDFEELHLLTPGITWSPDGKKIAISAKAGADDAIYIIDVATGDTERLPVVLDGIFSVEWSPNGNMIAYIGNSARQSDIWVYDLTTKNTTNLTQDVFSDAQPSWSPDGNRIYFASDRKNFTDKNSVPKDYDIFRHDYSHMDLYEYDFISGKIRRLTKTENASESYPIIGPDGRKMLYLSDLNGINNIFLRDLETDEEYPITNSLSGLYQISLSRDGSKLACSSMYEAGFDIFLLKSPYDLPKLSNLKNTEYIQRRNREFLLAKRNDLSGQNSFSDTLESETKSYGGEIEVQLGLRQNPSDTTGLSGNQRRVLFQPGETDAQKAEVLEQDTTKFYVNEKGEFIINKYKLSFTPDLVYGNAGFSTFYGIIGSTIIVFSDMLGDHQIYFLTNLMGDIKNSDYGFAYYYLPNRIDWGVEAFHTARFLYGTGLNWYYLYRYRQYGGSLSMSYPFDKFNRIEGSVTLMNVNRQNLDNPDEPLSDITLLLPNIAYVHDNSLWGTWSPVRGSRYELRCFGSPGLTSRPLNFVSVMLDYRTYFKYFKDFSLVLRGACGGSFGRNPQRFFIGGTENWLNRTFENNEIPISDLEDFAFLTPIMPLRGYNYNARIATKYALGNAEFRFPLVKYFLGGVLPYLLQSINGAFFVDIGGAVDNVKDFRPFTRDESGRIVNGNLLIGTGYGLRMWFFGFPWKFDVAWAYTGAGFSSPKYYISLGADF